MSLIASVRTRPNPSLHLTFASRLRRLSPADELKRCSAKRSLAYLAGCKSRLGKG